MWEWRPTRFAILRRTVLSFLVGCLALAGTAWVLPGLPVDGLGPLVLGGALLAAANAASGLIGHWLFVRLPILVVQVAGLVVQFVGILIVGRVVPGVHVDGLATALEGALLLTLLNGFLADVVSVSDDDSYYSVLVRRLIARRGAATARRARACSIVQLDGVGRPVLEGALRAGHMPNVDRMLRSGDAALHSWRTLLPPTTPASQAGILHGKGDAIPGFRWYEKETGRVMVANHPEDASAVLERISDGRGLLADDGASIGNLFTGDAPRSYLTMATIREAQPPDDERRARGFFVSTVNYTRLGRAHGRRGAQGAVPGGTPAGAGRVAAHASRPALRHRAGGDQRGPAHDLHGPGHRGDVPRRAGHLRRLHGVRRGGPPLRARAAGVHRCAGGHRPRHRIAPQGGCPRHAPLPRGAAVRPRPEHGSDLPPGLRPARGGPAGQADAR